MFGGFFHRMEDALEAGARARLLHGSWLSQAMSGHLAGIPRIPVKRVSEGGFSGLMRTIEGRAWAERWWDSAWAYFDDE